jgi:phosphatidylglycerol:prolipoprotein diacylglycerol transferase
LSGTVFSVLELGIPQFQFITTIRLLKHHQFSLIQCSSPTLIDESVLLKLPDIFCLIMIRDMYPILSRYGSLFIYSYTIMMALGIVVCIFLLQRLAHRFSVPHWVDAFLVVMAGGLIGGRVGFVIWRWDYFQENLPEMWQIWQGGLSYHTALFLGMAALAVWAALHDRPLLNYAVFFAPAFVLMTAVGWSACWLEGCAYGQETMLGILAANLPDDYGVFTVRYRTQGLGFLLTMVVLFLILRMQKNRPHSTSFYWALGAVSLIHLLISLLRGDPTVVIGSLRLDTLLNGFLVAITLLLQYVQRKDRNQGTI